MIGRIFRVAAYMFRHLFWYAACGLAGKGRRRQFLSQAYVAWAHYALRVFDVALQVEGRENFPASSSRPRVLLSNHQSQIDIPALVAATGETIGFVAKQELGRIPLLAYWMRQVGCVFIDRGRQSNARKVLEETSAHLGPNALVVFPEGTRSKSGALLPVKLGGLRMAVLARAQIIPVHVANSRNAFEARPARARVPIPVRVRFFPALDAQGWKDGKPAWLEVKAYLEKCWAAGEAD